MTCKWLNFDFNIYDFISQWSNKVGGIYIFSGPASDKPNVWYPYYIGKAESFAARIPYHDKWSPAVQLGATHVHALVVQQEETRKLLESLLIEKYNPSLNIQGKYPPF